MLLPKGHSGILQGGKQRCIAGWCSLWWKGMTVSNCLCCFTLRMRRSTWTLSRAMDWVSFTSSADICSLFWQVSRSVDFAWHTVVHEKTFVNHNSHVRFQQTQSQTAWEAPCRWWILHTGMTQRWLRHVVPCQLSPWRCSGIYKRRTLYFEAEERMEFGTATLQSITTCVSG